MNTTSGFCPSGGRYECHCVIVQNAGDGWDTYFIAVTDTPYLLIVYCLCQLEARRLRALDTKMGEMISYTVVETIKTSPQSHHNVFKYHQTIRVKWWMNWLIWSSVHSTPRVPFGLICFMVNGQEPKIIYSLSLTYNYPYSTTTFGFPIWCTIFNRRKFKVFQLGKSRRNK